MWTIFKAFNSLQYCLCFWFWLLAMRHVGLSSLIRGQPHTSALEGKVITSEPLGGPCITLSNSSIKSF